MEQHAETTRLWKLIQRWLDTQFFSVSQAQLADKVGVSRNAVSKWKFGEARPTPENLRAISQITGIAFHDLRIAVVEDLGYTLEGHSDDETSMNRAPVSGASEVTVHAETEDVPVNPQEVEVTGAQPPRPGPRADRP